MVQAYFFLSFDRIYLNCTYCTLINGLWGRPKHWPSMNDLLEKVPLNHFKCTLIEAQLVIMSGFTTSFEPQDNYFLLVYHDMQLTWQGVQTLDNDKHVVYPNPKQQEGHYGVGRGVEEAQSRAQAIADLRMKFVMMLVIPISKGYFFRTSE